jgi:hypothetical protein
MADNVIPFSGPRELDQLRDDLLVFAAEQTPGNPMGAAGALFSAAFRTMSEKWGEDRATEAFRAMMSAAIGAGLTSPAVLLPMVLAPRDRFVLLYDPSEHASGGWSSAPWIIGKGDEEGRWFDEDGYPLTPTGWVALPEVPTDG